jgi:ethanolamine utilization protein EutA (predicted chaperonin)
MKPTKEAIRQAIDAYFTKNPDGLDVTAYVLDRIGQDDMEVDAKTTHRSMDQAKQEMGKLISQELLPQLFSGVEVLDNAKVDAGKWPDLSHWVATYTRHRVGRRR